MFRVTFNTARNVVGFEVVTYSTPADVASQTDNKESDRNTMD